MRIDFYIQQQDRDRKFVGSIDLDVHSQFFSCIRDIEDNVKKSIREQQSNKENPDLQCVYYGPPDMMFYSLVNRYVSLYEDSANELQYDKLADIPLTLEYVLRL